MIAAWMGYTLAVGVVLAVAARALEWAFTVNGRALRGVWMGALVLAIGLPLWMLVDPPEAPPLSVSVRANAFATRATPSIETDAPLAGVHLERWNTPLIALWAGASAVGLLVVGTGVLRLRIRRRRWQATRVEDTDVRVSDDFGPAVLGFGRPEIVLPRWALSLPPGERTLLLTHEREHRKAGDTRVLASALGLVLSMPWNPAVVWMFGRLRRSVELDCDRRVLSAGASPKAYGALLLRMGVAATGSSRLATTFAEPRSLLERRIEMILRRETDGRVKKTVIALGLTTLMVVVACETPPPTQTAKLEVTTVEVADEVVTGEFKVTDVDIGADSEAEVKVRAVGDRQAPLIVVDGVITDHEIADLDALDIESIEVIKGAATRERYDSPRASNGVIHITTKNAPQREYEELRHELTDQLSALERELEALRARVRSEGAAVELAQRERVVAQAIADTEWRYRELPVDRSKQH